MSFVFKDGWAVGLDASEPTTSSFPWSTPSGLPRLSYPTLPHSTPLHPWQMVSWRRRWPQLHLILFTSGQGPARAEEVQFLTCCLHPVHQSLFPWGQGWNVLQLVSLNRARPLGCKVGCASSTCHFSVMIYCFRFVLAFKSSCLWRFANTWSLFTMWQDTFFLLAWLSLHRSVFHQGYYNTSLFKWSCYFYNVFKPLQGLFKCCEILVHGDGCIPSQQKKSSNFLKFYVQSESLTSVRTFGAERCLSSPVSSPQSEGFQVDWLLHWHHLSFLPVFLVPLLWFYLGS